jgi:hypothetical protein
MKQLKDLPIGQWYVEYRSDNPCCLIATQRKTILMPGRQPEESLEYIHLLLQMQHTIKNGEVVGNEGYTLSIFGERIGHLGLTVEDIVDKRKMQRESVTAAFAHGIQNEWLFKFWGEDAR